MYKYYIVKQETILNEWTNSFNLSIFERKIEVEQKKKHIKEEEGQTTVKMDATDIRRSRKKRKNNREDEDND